MADKDWQNFIEKHPDLDLSGFDPLKEEAYIKKVGNEWCIYSESGKPLGCKPTRPAAEKRLKQIEMFKHMKKKKGSDEEFSSQECYCHACGSYFVSRKRCDQSKCPACGEQDDIIEITGVTD